ncbi:hypothetical protein [Deinococcus sp.]|uniref:hypothetical protein n=1 Tax=Deinococcus sp. TaxID=47478 RepID=UPI003C7A5574
MCVTGIIALGMTFIISGGIDLSVGSMAALIAGSVIPIMNAPASVASGRPVWPEWGLIIGGLAGLFHGVVTEGC